MVKRSDRQLEKQQIIKKLSDYGLQVENLKSLSTRKLRCTLHVIKSEMKTISKPVKIVIISGSAKDDCISIEDSECEFCDTSDSECEYCDSDLSESD